ncbi:MAG: SpoIID/LytB domain-containing protein [Planctomycetes bacterium]|nr:SpoIID/LytB domain-containing protein [Planctomycetota bacterium]
MRASELRRRLSALVCRALAWFAVPRRSAALGALAAAVSLTVVRCSSPRTTSMPEVQVLLDRDVSTVDLALDGAYRVVDEGGGTVAEGRRLAAGRLRAAGSGLDLNGVVLRQDEVLLQPLDDDRFQYKGKSYAGDLRVRRDRTGRLEVTNVVDIEEYLAGVLYSEMPASFPDEALKAQAVAARTYARWRLGHGDPLLRATDADQVYGGASSRHERAREIVAATSGLVLEAAGQPLCAYFMSTCGGATVDAPLIFTGTPIAGLAGVPCEWCRESPKYRWTKTLTPGELARRVGLKDVIAVDVERDRAGHTIRFDVRSSGASRSFASQEFRRAWNAGATSEAEKLPSAWARALDVTRGEIRFEGAGFGHGVGLCQYGAAGLAKAGKEWREIIAHYYRGAQLVKRW